MLGKGHERSLAALGAIGKGAWLRSKVIRNTQYAIRNTPRAWRGSIADARLWLVKAMRCAICASTSALQAESR